MKNDVWEIVPRCEGKSIVDSRWLYKVKHTDDGSIETYKAWFVVRGFSQRARVNYEETFVPISRYTSIKTIMSLSSVFGWQLYQMDVKTTFLNGMIEEEVYINPLRGSEVHGRKTHVCRLKKSLYKLKQAPHAWYSKIDEYLFGLGFQQNFCKSNLYYLFDRFDLLVFVMQVDDLILTRNFEKLVAGCKAELAHEFEMKDIGVMHHFMGLKYGRVQVRFPRTG